MYTMTKRQDSRYTPPAIVTEMYTAYRPVKDKRETQHQ